MRRRDHGMVLAHEILLQWTVRVRMAKRGRIAVRRDAQHRKLLGQDDLRNAVPLRHSGCKLHDDQGHALPSVRRVLVHESLAMSACDSCGKPATCVGQFDGSCTPTYACDACCDHDEQDDGECAPLEPEPPQWADGSSVKLVTRRVPKIDPETGEQEKDEETGELLFTKEIDFLATFFANPFPAKRLADSVEEFLKKLSEKKS
jgi:hypothetical protein